MKTNIIYTILIIVLGLILYANSTGGEFVWDDSALIADNTYIRSWHNIPQIFTKSIGAGAGKYSRSYRPVQILSYLIDFSLWKTDIRGFHLTNIILHILVALSLFKLVGILFSDDLLAFITGILYIAHPIHTEAISYLSGRADPLSAFFILLGLIFYVKDAGKYNIALIISTGLAYALALFSRESALIFPVLLLVYHFSFKKKLYIAKFSLVLGVTFAYLLLRLSALSYMFSNMPDYPPFFERVPGFFVALTNYVRLLVLPIGLHMEYGPKVFSFLNIKAALGLLLLAAMLAYALRKGGEKRLFCFSILWFLAALLPQSNIYPVNAYMAEHWLYLPSIGFFIIIAERWTRLYRRREFKVLAIIIVAALVGIYSFLTVKQNTYWFRPIPFYERTIKYSPDSPKVYYNLANTYKNDRRFKEAIEYYKESISIEPEFSDSYNNLGNVYNLLKMYQEAIAAYKKAIEIRPDFADAYNNIAIVYSIIGRNEDAMRNYKKAIEIDPDYAIAYNGIGIIYALKGEEEEALDFYKKALEKDPEYYNAWNNIGTIYHRMGRMEEAISSYRKAIELDPDGAEAYCNLAEVYANIGKHKEAIGLCEITIEKDPNNAKAYYNIANSYSALGRNKEAVDFYKKSLDKKPGNPYTYNNMGMAYNELNMFTEAMGAYQMAVSLKPDYGQPYNNIGMVYFNQGMHDEALEMFKKAIELQPEYAIAHFNMALTYYKKEQYDLALQECDRSVKLGHKPDPEFLKLLNSHRETIQ